jgi:hypothetical protein
MAYRPPDVTVALRPPNRFDDLLYGEIQAYQDLCIAGVPLPEKIRSNSPGFLRAALSELTQQKKVERVATSNDPATMLLTLHVWLPQQPEPEPEFKPQPQKGAFSRRISL